MRIDRIERPTARELATYTRSERPVIIAGGVRDWPAVGTWTPETLARRFGDVVLPVEILDEDRATDASYRRKHLRVERMPLRRYLEICESGGSRHYMAQVPKAELDPRMRAELGRFDYMPRLSARVAWYFWAGPSGAASGLHYDSPNNFNIQLVGSKRWTLFPREQQHLLYLPSKELRHFSPIVLAAPDLDRFPKFRRATPIEVTLHAGEILYIPSRWPHHVESTGFAVSLNGFFDTPSTLVTALRRSAVRRLRGSWRRLRAAATGG